MSKVRLITENLLEHIQGAIKDADTICILTSFIMKSGVKLLAPLLKEATNRGAEIKVCAGDYLYITQPDALKELIKIDTSIEVRLWRSAGTSFHPKAYLFQNNQEGILFVGSSNMSGSALTKGVEWNISMDESVAPDTFEDALKEFTYLYLNEQTIQVNQETIKEYEKEYVEYHLKNPNLVRTWTSQEEVDLMLPTEEQKEQEDFGDSGEVNDPPGTYEVIQPRPAQEMALDALNITLEEGYNSAMVVMATGLGKTYLAAFFAKKFKKILFVAHREEILHQARKSFKHVSPERSYGIYNGKEKEGDADGIFASVFTLSLKQHLEAFNPNDFDLIIIDEFHHSAATTYQRILDYFNPKFLLGLTATPDRMDGKDVYAICDGNVAFQMHFLEAVQRGWLAPFHYYGVYDDTDYTQVRWLGTKYDRAQLLQVQLKEEMAEKVLQAWSKHKQTRTLAFCSSIEQASFLSSYFNQQGYQTIALHSKQKEIGRNEAIEKLKSGELDAIFTVDLFNEGVDIPPVDTLLFVRPTESLTIFTQQVGRGLRLHTEKDKCVIIDLIGNYRNADVKLSLFDTSGEKRKQKKAQHQPTVPEVCVIDLDVNVIDLLKEMAQKQQPKKDQLANAYFEVKKELGRRPTYLELHLYGTMNSKEYKSQFQSFVGFLYWTDELSDQEREVFKRYENWLIDVEKTSMTKSYKMIVIHYMLSGGVFNWDKPITPEETAPFFHKYLTEKEYRRKIDFSDKQGKQLWNYNDAKVSKLIADMPMSKWSGAKNSLVEFNNNQFSLSFDVAEEDREILYHWTKEICEYRLHAYFERKAADH